LIVLQGAFGAWTVTLKLWPQVVTAHLLGGFGTLALLWLLRLRLLRPAPLVRRRRLHAAVALAVLVVQIALGGWTTSNYAALACPDVPTCQGQWWPQMDFRTGFDVMQDVGPNYLGGVMHSQARAAIHMSHRLGALAAFVVVGWLALKLLRGDPRSERRLGVVLAFALIVQVVLGITNVVATLPLPVATAHNAVGAVLLLVLVSVNYRAFSRGVVA
jgi:cytochrome c oxidase assembly protein subunit 15